mmetsp:Transcript_31959/g.63344  ORF Transcript_31959/g.63344 Transcript_31959/m.63344 type:complete len:111 (+) Transcript_31959:1082-1414(+)
MRIPHKSSDVVANIYRISVCLSLSSWGDRQCIDGRAQFWPQVFVAKIVSSFLPDGARLVPVSLQEDPGYFSTPRKEAETGAAIRQHVCAWVCACVCKQACVSACAHGGAF